MVKCVVIPYMPIGWLSMLRNEFLHRDISIGNILMLDPLVPMKPFEARTIGQFMTRLSLQYEDELARCANLLEVVINLRWASWTNAMAL